MDVVEDPKVQDTLLLMLDLEDIEEEYIFILFIQGYIDYCCKCFAELKNKESDKAKEIIAKDAADGMSSDSLFTRVLFNYGGYTAF